MKQGEHHCPACGRAFESILDYPRVRVLAFERLPIPEAVDYLSPAAAAKTLTRGRESFDASAWSPEGINTVRCKIWATVQNTPHSPRGESERGGGPPLAVGPAGRAARLRCFAASAGAFPANEAVRGHVNLHSATLSRTPEIARACDTPEVREYLARLATMPDREVAPRELLPPLKPSGRFKWAYPVGDTGIYLSLADAAAQTGETRTAEVRVHCDGPNLGSAGGPTLQPLGAIALLHYLGLLAEGLEWPRR